MTAVSEDYIQMIIALSLDIHVLYFYDSFILWLIRESRVFWHFFDSQQPEGCCCKTTEIAEPHSRRKNELTMLTSQNTLAKVINIK